MGSNQFQNKNLVLGVCGGIAAYKSVELLRFMVKTDAMVRVVMTRNAVEFVNPLTFQALSGNAVLTSLFNKDPDASIQHIEWAQMADAVVIAPATANIIAKLSHGIADDAMSTFMLAVTCPVLICPSMNTHMYQHPATQRNLKRIGSYQHHILTPGAGELACGTSGPGRLPEPEDIFEYLAGMLAPEDLLQKHVLITAGPTREAIDPVRYISNPSSGRMGYALARAAAQRGAKVTLVSGPVALKDPMACEVIRVISAEEMAKAVLERCDQADIIIKTAAVVDFRPAETFVHKVKKNNAETTLLLKPTPDILHAIGKRKRPGQLLVGFAAETRALESYATDKLNRKNLDMIVGNLVDRPDSGFGSMFNTVTLFYSDGSHEPLASMEKDKLAHVIIDRIVARLMNRSHGSKV